MNGCRVVPQKRSVTIAAFGFGLWATWLLAEFLVFGQHSFVTMSDNANQSLPMRLSIAHALQDQQLGLWYPYVMSGVDQVSLTHTTDLWVLLYVTLPAWLAHGLELWIQRFVAGFFTYRMMRDVMKQNVLPSVIAGMAYSLYYQPMTGGYVIYDALQQPGLPMLIWLLDRSVGRFSYRMIAYAILLGFGFSFVSIGILAVFVLPLVPLWLIWISPRPWKPVLVLSTAFAFGLMIGEMPIFLALILNGGFSHRQDRGDLSWMMSATEALRRYFAPNFVYICVIVGSILFNRKRTFLRLVLLLIGIVLAVWGTGELGTLINKMLFGSSTTLSLERLYFLIPILMITTASVGLGSITTRRQWHRIFHTSALVLFLNFIFLQSVWVKWEHLFEASAGQSYANLYDHPQVNDLKARLDSEPLTRVVSIYKSATLPRLEAFFAAAYGLEAADGYVVLYPERYQRFWSAVIYNLTQQDPYFDQLFNAWGNSAYLFPPVKTAPYLDEGLFEEYFDLDLLSLANVGYVISAVPLTSERLQLISVSKSEAEFSSLDISQRIERYLSGNYISSALYIYENSDVLPRIMTVSSAQIFPTLEALLDMLRSAELESLTTTAYVLVDDISGETMPDGEESPCTIESTSIQGDYIRIQVDCIDRSILKIMNSFSPYWTAEMDGISIKLFPVDMAFTGLSVPEGQHDIVLRYQPFNFLFARKNFR